MRFQKVVGSTSCAEAANTAASNNAGTRTGRKWVVIDWVFNVSNDAASSLLCHQSQTTQSRASSTAARSNDPGPSSSHCLTAQNTHAGRISISVEPENNQITHTILFAIRS